MKKAGTLGEQLAKGLREVIAFQPAYLGIAVFLALAVVLLMPAYAEAEEVDARQVLRLLAADLGLRVAFARDLNADVKLDAAGLGRAEAVSRVVRSLGWASRRVGNVLVITRSLPHRLLPPPCNVLPAPLDYASPRDLARIVRKHWPTCRVRPDEQMWALYVYPRYLDDAVEVKTMVQFLDGDPQVR